MSQELFDAKQFGLDGKALAIVDLDKLLLAMTFVKQQAAPTLYAKLKAEYHFKVVPVESDLYGMAGKKTAVVDHERALRAIAFIKANIEPHLLEVLRAEYEFDLLPIQKEQKPGVSKAMYFIGCKVLKWSIVALVAVKILL